MRMDGLCMSYADVACSGRIAPHSCMIPRHDKPVCNSYDTSHRYSNHNSQSMTRSEGAFRQSMGLAIKPWSRHGSRYATTRAR